MGKSALKLVDRLAMDMLKVECTEADTPKSCGWGIENEWLAVQVYEERTMRQVRPAEFTASKTHAYIGGTMDGLIGLDGGIEVKCPFSEHEHLANLTDAAQVKRYYPQMQGYMFIFNLKWIDFVSFDPRFPEPLQLVVHRVERDDAFIETLVARCELVRKMAAAKVRKVKKIGAAKHAG